MDRRTFIATGAAVPLATLPAAASSIDPLTGMFARWEAARREWNRLSEINGDWDIPEMLALEREQSAMFKRMAKTKAQTLQGLLSQITLLWEDCGLIFFGAEPSEASDPDLRLKCQILLGAESLVGAPAWQPINPKFLSPSEF